MKSGRPEPVWSKNVWGTFSTTIKDFTIILFAKQNSGKNMDSLIAREDNHEQCGTYWSTEYLLIWVRKASSPTYVFTSTVWEGWVQKTGGEKQVRDSWEKLNSLLSMDLQWDSHKDVGRACACDGDIIIIIIYEKQWQRGQVTFKWKKANSTLVFKKGRMEDPGSYRPVSLASVPEKLWSTFSWSPFPSTWRTRK